MSENSDESIATPVAESKPIKSNSLLATALAKAQGEFVQPEKNKTVRVYNKDRVFLYESKYADLKNVIESFRSSLSKYGLSFTQKTIETPRGWRLVLILRHESGETDETSMPIQLEQAPQQVGSQLTYLKRYQASAYFGIAADDDDDGNAAQGTGNQAAVSDNKKPKSEGPKPKSTTPPPKPKEVPKEKVTLASPEQLQAIDEMMATRDITSDDLIYFTTTGYGLKEPLVDVPEKLATDLLSLLESPTINGTALREIADNMYRERSAPTPAKKTMTIPAEYVMPFGEVKGKSLNQINEKTLKAITQWCSKQMKVTPPPTNIGDIIEANRQVKAFLDQVGES